MKKLRQQFALLIGIVCNLLGQEQTATTPPPAKPPVERSAQPQVRRVVPVRHVSAKSVSFLLPVEGIIIRADSDLGFIVLAGTPERVQEAEELIRQMDVPRTQSANPELTASTPNNIEITMHLVAVAAPGVENVKPPVALQPVIQKIESTFGIRGLYLLDTALLRGRAGSQTFPGSKIAYRGSIRPAQSESNTPNTVVTQPTNYTLELQLGGAQGPKGSRVISLNHFSINTRLQYSVTSSQGNTQNVAFDGSFTVDADLQENQPTVIGKGSLLGPDQPVFVILQARVL